MTNPPRVHFFTTPRNQFSYNKLYTPPKQETDLIAKFIELGYAPVVDSLLPCPPLQNVRGLYWCIGEAELSFTKATAHESINPFLLIYWYGPMSCSALEAARQFFSDLLGLRFKRKIITRQMSKMLQGNYFKPTPPQPLLFASVERHDYVETLSDGRIVVNRIKGGDLAESVNELVHACQVELNKLEGLVSA